MPVSKSVRVLKLLNIRTFELEQGVHHVFDRVWSSLVHVDVESGRFIVRETIAGTCGLDPHPPFECTDMVKGEHMALTEAVKGLKAYNEIEKRATDLWHDLDAAIITPRMNILQENIPGISADDVRCPRCHMMRTRVLTSSIRRLYRGQGLLTRPHIRFWRIWRQCFPSWCENFLGTLSRSCRLP